MIDEKLENAIYAAAERLATLDRALMTKEKRLTTYSGGLIERFSSTIRSGLTMGDSIQKTEDILKFQIEAAAEIRAMKQEK